MTKNEKLIDNYLKERQFLVDELEELLLDCDLIDHLIHDASLKLEDLG